MLLKQRKQIFQINVTELKIPTGRRQTSWCFAKDDQGYEFGRWQGGDPELGTSGLQPQRHKPLDHAASFK